MSLFNKLSTQEKWIAIRGIFETQKISESFSLDTITLSCVGPNLYTEISSFINIDHVKNGNNMIFYNVNKIDLLSKMYDESIDPIYDFKQKYVNMLGYATDIPVCTIIKDTNSVFQPVVPTKCRASDEGYDLTLVGIQKTISKNTVRYDTGIKVIPPEGYHIEILPRSSLSNTGYVLSNSVGLIDSGYTGNLLVTLTKIDQSLPDFTLPFKAVQFVLRKNHHFLLNQKSGFDLTSRGNGGFGSTDSSVSV